MKNMQVVESVVMNSLFCIILIVATVSNSLLLIVFRRRPGLRTISNRFVINLLITNMATCWLLIPLLLADNMWLETRRSSADQTSSTESNESLFFKHESFCRIREGLAIGLCTANVLSVLLIGADQYFAVLDPLRYHASINATTSAVMIGSCWLLSSIFAVIGGLTISTDSSTRRSNSPSSRYGCSVVSTNTLLPYQIAFPIVFTVLVFSIPFTGICWIYFSIYSAAHRNSQRARRNGSIAGFNTTNDNVANAVVLLRSTSCSSTVTANTSTKNSFKSTSSMIVNSLRRRISNSSLFRYREETRAARISALVIVMALFCWFPFTLLLLLRSPIFDNDNGDDVSSSSNNWLSYYVKQLGVLALTCSAVASPLIFAHRNRRIHKELCRLFRRSKRRYSFYDRKTTTKQRQRLLPKSKTFDVLLTLDDDNTQSVRYDDRNRTKICPTTARNSAANSNSSSSSSSSNGGILSCLSSNRKRTTASVDSGKKKTVSILSKVWIIDKRSDHRKPISTVSTLVDLPEAALEVDTSRSSFSSNSSATSTATTESSQSQSSYNSSNVSEKET